VAPSRAATAAYFVEQQLALRLAGAAPDAAPLSLSVRLDVAGPGQTPVMSIRLPFGLDLAAGLRVAVDSGQPSMLPFTTCEPNGCLIRATLTPEEVAAMKAGLTLNLGFAASDGRSPSASIPLAGFTDALASIE
jgi:invasion protein IalB